MNKNILDNVMDLKVFLRTIIHYQEVYWEIEDSIKPFIKDEPITAKDVEIAHKEMNYIAEQVARFILNRNTKVNIYNLEQLK